ncbi:hypothetical protein SLE2022_314700 [Rubroshorea leprosula]
MVWLRISGVPLKSWCDRCFERIAGTIMEVLLVHEDTRTKFILCSGQVLILCGDENKVSKTLRLKVNRKLYEINMVEVEWRTDLDWWLSDGDWSYDMATESEYSLSKNGDEDHGLFNIKICGEEYDSNEDEQLQREGDSNLNGKSLTAIASDSKDGVYSNGPVLSKENGLEIESELVVSLYQEKV